MIIKAEVIWLVPVTLDIEPGQDIATVQNKIIIKACEGFIETTPQITKCDEIPEVKSV